MAALALWTLLSLLAVLSAFRAKHRSTDGEAVRLVEQRSAAGVPDGEQPLQEGLTEDLHTEYVEPREPYYWPPGADTVSAQWSPCAVGMCYDSWGDYRTPNQSGTGGIGSRGCWGGGDNPWFNCPGDSTFMDCIFGPCPKYFGSPACVGASGCKSYCDVRRGGGDNCTYTGPRINGGFSSWMQEFHHKPLNKVLVLESHHHLARLKTLDFENPVESSRKILDDLAFLNNIPGAGAIAAVAYASLLPVWASCQSSDTTSLLHSGVRSFDLRPYLSKSLGHLRDHHGGRGPAIEEAFGDIAAFVRSHPSEVVYVRLRNIISGTDRCLDCKSWDETTDAIISAVSRHFGTCGGGMLLCEVDVSRTLGQLVQEGNVIVHTNENNLHQSSGTPRTIHSPSLMSYPWWGQHNLWELEAAMLNDTRHQAHSRESSRLIGHAWILTPRAEDITGSISSKWTSNYQDKANRHGCQSLACFGEVASAESFRASFESIIEKYPRSNLIMLDFADRPGGMEMVQWVNRYKQ